jgi:hypothetical protein
VIHNVLAENKRKRRPNREGRAVRHRERNLLEEERRLIVRTFSSIPG